MTLAEGKHIQAADLPPLLSSPTTHALPLAGLSYGPGPSLREQTLALMQNTLSLTKGDVVAAASRLRVGRSTLYRLLPSDHLRLPQD